MEFNKRQMELIGKIGQHATKLEISSGGPATHGRLGDSYWSVTVRPDWNDNGAIIEEASTLTRALQEMLNTLLAADAAQAALAAFNESP